MDQVCDFVHPAAIYDMHATVCVPLSFLVDAERGLAGPSWGSLLRHDIEQPSFLVKVRCTMLAETPQEACQVGRDARSLPFSWRKGCLMLSKPGEKGPSTC